MELLANELSIHGQFHDISSFHAALERLMAMRVMARRYGREVYCHRALLTACPMPDISMQQAIGRLEVQSKRRAAMVWLTRGGPFWDDLRHHDADDYLECRGDVVTDYSPGEAAYRKMHGADSGLVSIIPSDWDFSPVEVIWRREAEGLGDQRAAVENLRAVTALEDRLEIAAPPIRSWTDLREASTIRFQRLTFSDDCFQPLEGAPFARSAAERFVALLGILDRLAHAFDAAGRRTPEGHQLYRDYFTGCRSWFSDSSDSEKREFRNELTFPHPNDPVTLLFCTWHGKVSRMTLRLHYSWSGQAGEPVFVVYAGPKITRR